MKKIIISLLIMNIVLALVVYFDGRQEKKRNMALSDAFVEMRMAYDEQRFTDAYDQGVQLLQRQKAEDVYYLLALSAYRIEKFEESTEYFHKVIDKNHNRMAQPIFLLQFAESLMASGENEEALNILRRAEQIAPDEQYMSYINAYKERIEGRAS